MVVRDGQGWAANTNGVGWWLADTLIELPALPGSLIHAIRTQTRRWECHGELSDVLWHFEHHGWIEEVPLTGRLPASPISSEPQGPGRPSRMLRIDPAAMSGFEQEVFRLAALPHHTVTSGSRMAVAMTCLDLLAGDRTQITAAALTERALRTGPLDGYRVSPERVRQAIREFMDDELLTLVEPDPGPRPRMVLRLTAHGSRALGMVMRGVGTPWRRAHEVARRDVRHDHLCARAGAVLIEQFGALGKLQAGRRLYFNPASVSWVTTDAGFFVPDVVSPLPDQGRGQTAVIEAEVGANLANLERHVLCAGAWALDGSRTNDGRRGPVRLVILARSRLQDRSWRAEQALRQMSSTLHLHDVELSVDVIEPAWLAETLNRYV
jgi:hypothetical protein